MTPAKQRFLVLHDRGKIGALWGVIEARSANEITAMHPELEIVDERPAWMSLEELGD
jgi:hypothetical protein